MLWKCLSCTTSSEWGVPQMSGWGWHDTWFKVGEQNAFLDLSVYTEKYDNR